MNPTPHSQGQGRAAFTPDPTPLAPAAQRAQIPCPCAVGLRTLMMGREFPIAADTIVANGVLSMAPGFFMSAPNPAQLNDSQELVAFLNDFALPAIRAAVGEDNVTGGFIDAGAQIIVPRVGGECIELAIIPNAEFDVIAPKP